MRIEIGKKIGIEKHAGKVRNYCLLSTDQIFLKISIGRLVFDS